MLDERTGNQLCRHRGYPQRTARKRVEQAKGKSDAKTYLDEGKMTPPSNPAHGWGQSRIEKSGDCRALGGDCQAGGEERLQMCCRGSINRGREESQRGTAWGEPTTALTRHLTGGEELDGFRGGFNYATGLLKIFKATPDRGKGQSRN